MNDKDAVTWIKYVLPSLEERQQIQESIDFKNFITFWNRGKYNTRRRVGSLMEELNKLPLNATKADWVNHYFNKVRSPSQIIEQVNEITITSKLPVETILVYWWIHIIDMSWAGGLDEKACNLLLEDRVSKKGLQVVPVHLASQEGIQYPKRVNLDTDCGIDSLIVDSEKNVISGVQIKGIKYFLSPRPTVKQARKKFNPPKYQKFKTFFPGSTTHYMLIEPSLYKNEPVLLPAPYLPDTLPLNIRVILDNI